MSEYRGYHGKALEFLKQYNLKVGDTIQITTDSDQTGTIMPRYEHSDDKHIAVKLKSGYNVGLEIDKIKKVQYLSSTKSTKEASMVVVNQDLPKILLLSTGGTIASRVDYRTGSVTPALSAQELNASVPELAEVANIDAEVLFSEYSENLTPDHWLKIAQKLDSLAKSDYAGILVAHGTDTMQYTAAYLSFALAGFPKPIVLVGSQRSSDRPSSDAAINLIYAARFIVRSKTNGVFVAMHNSESDNDVACHLGTRVRKNHTSKRNAFETVGAKPAFVVYEDKITQNFHEPYFTQERYDPKIDVDTKAALVKYYPGYDPNLIEDLLNHGYKAIIFEGTGLGHIGRTMYDVVKKAKQKGVFVGMTSQCLDGRVNMAVYESGRDLMQLGIVPLSDMIPETALVKAMWALSNHNDIKEIMLKNIASELTQ
ncbi:MAG TPA: Glu-tRNA(Gln) amidotransferase subunit GatD [Candidatus Nitrosotenuis sp.]|jgi:glutamyl-tRNA(Gln) amidotransferase subunit D|nr:Glu-tRNA(Gln) amidotransferase subunit GatD [Candidatus Nitrosotenuis sp.]